MTTLSLLGRCGLAACWFVATALAAPVPHPTREGRLVEERDGFRVEYSPGQEAYAEAMFGALKEFAVKEAQLAAVPAVVQPGSWAELQAHRDEILRQVAAEIGLAAPTEHQGRIFDALLDHYEFFSREVELQRSGEVDSSRPNHVEIWNRGELVRRLTSGEKLEGLGYNAVNDSTSHSSAVVSGPLVSGDLQVGTMKLRQSPEGRSFSYSTKGDSVVDVTIDYHFNGNGLCEVLARCLIVPGQPMSLRHADRTDHWERALVEARQRDAKASRVLWSVLLGGWNSEKTPVEVANDLVDPAWSKVSEILARPDYVEAVTVHTILHEVAEAGIVESYIISPDRRWLCEGMANFVAWKVLRDRCGADFAQQGYDLNTRLAAYVALQPKIDMRLWRAIEVAKGEERDMPLMCARYAFATRAVFEMVRENGEAVVPKLFQEIAKTPRSKVRMRTVERAYRKTTGKKLGDVIKFAETTPVADGK